MKSSPLFLDVETNGFGTFRPPTQRIVQIGYIFGNKAVSKFVNDVEKVNPKVPHPYDVQFLNQNGENFREIISQLYDDMKECTHIVAHNYDFDAGCLINELLIRSRDNDGSDKNLYANIISEINKKKHVDTMKSTTNICKLPGNYGYKWPKLEELYVFCFSKSPDGSLHDALTDCVVMKDCFEHLINNNMIQLL